MLSSKGTRVRVIKCTPSDVADGVLGDDEGVIIGRDGVHFFNVKLDRTGQVHPFYPDQLKVLPHA